MIRKIDNVIKHGIEKLDQGALWILGVIFLMLTFLPIIIMQENCVYSVHDQLDETILDYVLTARHLFSNEYPEMMCGINASGLMPPAVIFLPLYMIFPLFWAFSIQYFLVAFSAFGGMYGLIKKATDSSGIALLCGMIFALLPYRPIYGLSVVGVPLVILCFWNLYANEKKVISYFGIVYFALSTQLVFIGLPVLAGLFILSFIMLFRNRKGILELLSKRKAFIGGCVLLIGTYMITNIGLIRDVLIGNNGFISHRSAWILNEEGIDTGKNIFNILVYGDNIEAPTCHTYFLPFAIVITVLYLVLYKKLSPFGKRTIRLVCATWGILLAIALMHGFLVSPWMMHLRNQSNGIVKYYNFDRIIWATPALWWILFGLCASLIWRETHKVHHLLRLVGVLIITIPTLLFLKPQTILYDNINQYNNGYYTGKLSWSQVFMNDELEKVDKFIGEDKSTYRIAHIGLNPAPALVYGFYTIDGYSNNYDLRYKKEFREIIENEIEHAQYLLDYFDNWGSRCYLFSSQSANENGEYGPFDFNYDKMLEMNCKYILSSHKINDETGQISLLQHFTSEQGSSDIWLYRVNGSM